jgi:hypothetical protein
MTDRFERSTVMHDPTAMTRRRLLATVAALAILPLPAFSGRPSPGFHLVNGWILTTQDLEDLRRYAV